MSRHDLLPPNATQLERDFSRATNLLRTKSIRANGFVVPGIGAIGLQQQVHPGSVVPIIRTAKRVNIPDSVVPWLIYEYGLGEILPYLGNNQRRAIEEGVLWQRIRGTPEAVRIALGWINVEGLIDESEGGSTRWAEYQLGLSAATAGDQIIDDIVGVCQISSPVRSRLQRIYAVYDFRRFLLDDSLLSDGGMLSDHSGVRPQPDWPQISYGQIVSSLVEEDATVSSGHTDVIGVLVTNFDRFQLDHSLLDEEWHTINHPSLLTEQEGVSAQYDGQTWTSCTWQPTTWGDVNAVASSRVTSELDPNVVTYIPGLGAVAVDELTLLGGEDVVFFVGGLRGIAVDDSRV
jgi:P2-related tail formation protein